MDFNKSLISVSLLLFLFSIPLFSQEIHQEVKKGDTSRVESMLNEDPTLINAVDDQRRTPLFYAVNANNYEMARFLIAKGAGVNVIDDHDITPLHRAVAVGNLKLVQLLIENGAVVDARALGAASPLIWAAIGNKLDIAEYLISKGAEVNLYCNAHTTPLYLAVYNNNRNIVKMLLSHNADVNYFDHVGRTPLQVAVRDGYAEIAEILISHGAFTKLRDKSSGRTLLHLAAINGHKKVIEILLNHGAEVNSQDNKGFTPLDYAYRYGQQTVVQLLRSKGALRANKEKGLTESFTLDKSLHDNEAIIIKLQGGGWGIKTKSSFLIFGYAENRKKPSEPSLTNGYISQQDISKHLVYVFDVGYQSRSPLYAMQKELKNITFILNPAYRKSYERKNLGKIIFPESKKYIQINNLKVLTIPAWGKGCGYYISVDKLSILWLPEISDPYISFNKNTKGVKYLEESGAEVDILFLSSPYWDLGDERENAFREAYYASETLGAKALFPMGSEIFTIEVVRRLIDKIHKANFYCAENPGDRFLYQKGRVIK